jgi:hypothetical protein
MKRIIMAALLLASSALGAAADTSTYVFKDALEPSGHERGADVRHADGRACGVSGDLDMPADVPAFKKCMLARGWRLSRILTERSPAATGPLVCSAKVLQVQDTDVGLNDGAGGIDPAGHAAARPPVRNDNLERGVDGPAAA